MMDLKVCDLSLAKFPRPFEISWPSEIFLARREIFMACANFLSMASGELDGQAGLRA